MIQSYSISLKLSFYCMKDLEGWPYVVFFRGSVYDNLPRDMIKGVVLRVVVCRY